VIHVRIVPLLLLLGAPLVALQAQGVSTASIGGVVADASGRAIEAARVRVVNLATGVAITSGSGSGGRYVVDGLAVGGPYAVTVERIGYRPGRRDGLVLVLGQTLRLDFALEAVATELPPITVQADPDARFAIALSTGTQVSDSALRRLPTANRDLYSFAQLTPQIISRSGSSAAGSNSLFNGIRVDGANLQAFFGGNSAGGPVWGGKPISIEAVREYQVLLAPFDVRQGDFAGAQIIAVTRSGTNDWRGAAFYYWRNETLARDVSYLRASPYDRSQFGFTLGGPIMRDRVHFYVASELQRLSAPAAGPYVGQPAGSQTPLPVDTADINRFNQLLAAHGLEGGSAGPVSNTTPSVNLFARVDVALPRWNTRLTLRHNFSRADSNAFSRPTAFSTSCGQQTCFPFSSVGRAHRTTQHSTALHVLTNFRSGAYNEATLGRLVAPFGVTPNVRAPLIVVTVPRADAPGTARLQAGSIEGAHGFDVTQAGFEASDNLTLPLGAHRVTLGVASLWYHLRAPQVREAYGVWRFSNLDSLALNTAEAYQVTKDLGGADASLDGAHYSVYAGDVWQVGDRFSLTLGLRADLPIVHGQPPYAPSVDSLFGRRTDVVPSGQVLFSPRVGFTWTTSAARRDQLRGGVGLFAGRSPGAWLLRAFQNYGDGLGSLRCGGPGTAGPPPAFESRPDYRNPPTTCANGAGLRPGPVNLLDEHLKFPQTLRVALGYDRVLPWNVVGTVEGLYTRGVHDFFFVNENLRGPVGVDRRGRVMYGAVNPLGAASPDTVTSLFPEVIGLENQSRNYSYNITGRLEKRFSNGVQASAAYSFSRVRDVQTHLYPAFNDDWQFGRVVSGGHRDKHPGVSDFDQPHKVVLVATYTFPWASWKTDVSFYYVGTSGRPYTYTAGAVGTKGDLNADGSNVNDPIYVPRDAADTNEIQFTGTATEVATQQAAFDRFIAATPCLSRQRGRILVRNSCSSPWIHTLNLSVRQALPSIGRHALTAELQIFNFLNLLNRDWGQLRLPPGPTGPRLAQVGLLEQVGQTVGPLSQPVFRFTPNTAQFTSQYAASNYQMQLAARYTF